MKDQTKCFILTSNGYEELSYAELQERRENDPTYASKRFVPLHGMLLEVSSEDYHEFYRNTRRQKYIAEESSRAGAFSYNALDTENTKGEDVIVDPSLPIDDLLSDKLLIEDMLLCFGQLSDDDRTLLTALYFEGKSENAVANELGITQQAVNKRRQKAIRTLKERMGL